MGKTLCFVTFQTSVMSKGTTTPSGFLCQTAVGGDKNCSISKLSEILSSNNFFRINRQILVNIDYIQKLTPRTEHEWDIVLKAPFDSEKFGMSHTKRVELLELLDKSSGLII